MRGRDKGRKGYGSAPGHRWEGVGSKERCELQRSPTYGRGGVLPSPLVGEGLGMRGEVCHMVHGAALVAPYGGMSVGVAVVCAPFSPRGRRAGDEGRSLGLTVKREREANASLSL